MAISTRSPAPTRARRARRAPAKRVRRPPSAVIAQPLPVWAFAAIPLVALVALLVGVPIASAGRIYPGVSALGVQLGGLTQREAEIRLTDRTSHLSGTVVTLRLDDRQWQTSPEALGLGLQPRPLAAAAFGVGRDGNLLDNLTAGVSTLVLGSEVAWERSQADTGTLDAFVTSVAADVNRPVQEAHLRVKPDGSLDYQPGIGGRALDLAALQTRLRSVLFQGGVIDLHAFITETQPTMGDAQVADAHAVAERILATPLTLRFADRQWDIPRDVLATLLTFEHPADSAWTVKLDSAALKSRLASIADEINQGPEDARFSWDNGVVTTIRDSKDGRELDLDASLAAVQAALQSDNHTVELSVQVTKPAVDMRDPAALEFSELIDSGKTSFAGSIPAKQHNIKLAASRLNGVVVPPGGLFSFNKEVGPTTLDAGFEWGYGLESSGKNVKTVPSVAGGICQVATTLFQPVFWSGYQLEERNWHLYWIPAYASHGLPGLDATVDEASGLDFKFINNTPHALLIQSWTDETTVHFALYGTKPDWNVEVDDPVVTNERKADPKPQFEEQADQPWGWKLHVSAARDGFDIAIVRRVVQGGDTRTLRLTSTYQPSRDVTLIGSQGKPEGESLFPTETPTPDPAATPPPSGTTAAGATPAVAASDGGAAVAAATSVAGAATSVPAATPRQFTSAGGTPTVGAPPHAAAGPSPTPIKKPSSGSGGRKAKPTPTPAGH